VIAHSLGSFLLARATRDLLAEDLGKRRAFKEIVLTAPDIDADVFKRDIALRSWAWVRASRCTPLTTTLPWKCPSACTCASLGHAGSKITVLRDLDTIDASNVKTDFSATPTTRIGAR